MRRKLVTGVDAACPVITICVETNLISLGGIYSLQTLKNSLYDSYIRALRWASDRIDDDGVIAFVSNAGWIDGNAVAASPLPAPLRRRYTEAEQTPAFLDAR